MSERLDNFAKQLASLIATRTANVIRRRGRTLYASPEQEQAMTRDALVVALTEIADGLQTQDVGSMWEFDHLRPLGWTEYRHWMNNPLPFGWSIIQVPGKHAEPKGA